MSTLTTQILDILSELQIRLADAEVSNSEVRSKNEDKILLKIKELNRLIQELRDIECDIAIPVELLEFLDSGKGFYEYVSLKREMLKEACAEMKEKAECFRYFRKEMNK